jgi:hypothetical protein
MVRTYLHKNRQNKQLLQTYEQAKKTEAWKDWRKDW